MTIHDSLMPTELLDPIDVEADSNVDYRELLETESLPPLRLPEASELAHAARASSLLAAAHALGRWVGRGRAVDENTGQLGADDAAMAARELADQAVESSNLAELWELADELGFIAVGDDTAVADGGLKEWSDGEDAEVLGLWKQAFVLVSAWSLVGDAERSGVFDLRFEGAGSTVLPLFVSREEGITLEELNGMVREIASSESDLPSFDAVWQTWVNTHGEPATALYERLRRLGAVTITDGLVKLTPLALSALWPEIATDVFVPLLPPPEEMTADDVVLVAALGTAEQLAAEWEAWLSARPAVDAAAELAGAAAAGGSAERTAATALLDELGTEADAVWRSLLQDPRLRPYAKRWLGEQYPEQADFELSESERAWLLADMLCDLDVDDAPADVGELLGSTVRRGDEALFEAMWRLEHDGARNALRVLGRYHPDKTMAKEARKAAFKFEGGRCLAG